MSIVAQKTPEKKGSTVRFPSICWFLFLRIELFLRPALDYQIGVGNGRVGVGNGRVGVGNGRVGVGNG